MKKQITLRIDEEVLEWFKSKGKGYHGLMHKALEKYRMFNTPHIDLGDYYKDQEDTSGASGSEDEFIVRTGVLGIESSMENLIERIERLENCCKKCGMYKVVQVEERLTGAK